MWDAHERQFPYWCRYIPELETGINISGDVLADTSHTGLTLEDQCTHLAYNAELNCKDEQNNTELNCKDEQKC